ncbi:MAG: hypothetical protein ACI8SE_000772 [Bacteroidia bacterium]|jgi:hypothetical protein
MKKITYLFLIVALLATNALASIDIVNVNKFNQVQENTITIESRFGQSYIDASTDLSALKGLDIHHVDLVYTAYRTSKTFNQHELNERRMQALIKLLPQLAKKDPTWRAIRQTGATTSTEAQQYFHGFILHFGESLSYESQATFLEQFQEKPIVKQIQNNKQNTVEYSSGTTVSIPANAVVDMDGLPVKGNYNLEYTEFRDHADIVYSGIPMTYSNAGTEYNFSSVGMYEVRANQNGKELKLAKPIQIDFNATDIKEDVGFFQMNDETGEWKKLNEVEFDLEANETINPVIEEDVEFGAVANILVANDALEQALSWTFQHFDGTGHYTFSDKSFELLKAHIDTLPDWKMRLLRLNAEDKSITIKTKDAKLFEKLINESYADYWFDFFDPNVGNVKRNFNLNPIPNDTNATLLAEGSTDPGHAYPKLVKGLNSKAFGVYNCDQIYRIGKSKNLSPKYVDAKTGKEIKNKRVTCVMDLTYNGAFSFSPNFITCNLEGENVILLFTTDKKTYLLSAEKFDDVKSTEKNPVFGMTDMTKVLKSSADLKAYLKR